MRNNYIIRRKREFAQQDLELHRTKMIADMLGTAKRKKMAQKLIDGIFELLEVTAKAEWGDETTVDDFSAEGAVVVKSRRREETIYLVARAA